MALHWTLVINLGGSHPIVSDLSPNVAFRGFLYLYIRRRLKYLEELTHASRDTYPRIQLQAIRILSFPRGRSIPRNP